MAPNFKNFYIDIFCISSLYIDIFMRGIKFAHKKIIFLVKNHTKQYFYAITFWLAGAKIV